MASEAQQEVNLDEGSDDPAGPPKEVADRIIRSPT
jgi:hypothetical protein